MTSVNTFNWDMISYPYKHNNAHTSECKQLEYFSFCNEQKFIDKCLVINFHDNIFIFTLSFRTFFVFSRRDYFFFLHFPSYSKWTFAALRLRLCCSVFICRAFVYNSPPSLHSTLASNRNQLNHTKACTYVAFATYLWFSFDATT